MTSQEIRQSFFDFFKSKHHTIVPSAPVVPYDDPTLLFTNAGMNQFKDVFLGTGTRDYSRCADTQKCIRVSGKHNDLEEVGRDTYHHTFFEMLGNWSFGDYYKKEAISWAWELLTVVWGLEKNRLWATVYKDDDEAMELWKTVTDIDHSHILRFDEKDNFWEMGETGPCGPCSEIHYDKTYEGNAPAEWVNAGKPELVEIWNLVFIQFNRDIEGKLHPLPAKHVDTGMGFERICAVLQGTNSNYDTDVFTPLIKEITRLSATTYQGTLGQDNDIAMRVIADHIRALSFAIADGAIPSNEGRGYVLRRLLRRAARFGRTLGLKEPFMHKLVPTLVATMKHVFPELDQKSHIVIEVIEAEETSFNATLDRGLEIFEEVVERLKERKETIIPGHDVFRLYDTFGFPVDLTALLSTEKGFTIDEAGFKALMDEQRERSRDARGSTPDDESHTSVSLATREAAKRLDLEKFKNAVSFSGYDSFETEAEVLEQHGNFLLLSKTPFYGEQGGQVGDTGIIEAVDVTLSVLDTQKNGGIPVHILGSSSSLKEGERIKARVDMGRRTAIMRNHTATHLVHAALREILGTHVHQAGSLVTDNHLRFDFTHYKKVSPEELEAIEDLVNERIGLGIPLIHHRDIPFEEAQKLGALMFFGDKYGDRVNVVQFGEFSKEFCGGTHVANTSEIGFFKFRTEGSIASGTRRIEAVTHDMARRLLEWKEKDLAILLQEADHSLSELEALVAKIGSTEISNQLQSLARSQEFLKDSIAHVSLPSIRQLREAFNSIDKRALAITEHAERIATLRKKVQKELARTFSADRTDEVTGLVSNAVKIGSIRLVSSVVQTETMDELKSYGDSLRAALISGAGVLFSVLGEKVGIVCVVTDDLVAAKKLDAGKIVGTVAKLLGGGGGGRAHLASAGAKNIAGIPDAVAKVPDLINEFLTTS